MQCYHPGLATFLSEPRFEDVPVILETKLDRKQVEKARRLRKRGLKKRDAKAG
jgi:endonuclease IV